MVTFLTPDRSNQLTTDNTITESAHKKSQTRTERNWHKQGLAEGISLVRPKWKGVDKNLSKTRLACTLDHKPADDIMCNNSFHKITANQLHQLLVVQIAQLHYNMTSQPFLNSCQAQNNSQDSRITLYQASSLFSLQTSCIDFL